MDKLLHGGEEYSGSNVMDFDADSFDEVVLENRKVSLYFDPDKGGVLNELDSKEARHNLINTLARRKEAYHEKILKGDTKQEIVGLEECKTIHDNVLTAPSEAKDHLAYDRYERYGLIDHFLEEGTNIETFSRCAHTEMGDFVNGKYDFSVEKTEEGVKLFMKRRARVNETSVLLTKEIHLPRKDASFEVRYTILNAGETELNAVFGPEFNFVMPEANSDRYKIILDGQESEHSLNDSIQHEGAEKMDIRDTQGEFSLEVGFSKKCDPWLFPVRTVSQSERAYELNYQGSALLPRVPARLKPGEEKKFNIRINLIS
jgi:alpha-amylase